MRADEEGGRVGIGPSMRPTTEPSASIWAFKPSLPHQRERGVGRLAVGVGEIEAREAAGLVGMPGEILDHRHRAAAEGEICRERHGPESFRKADSPQGPTVSVSAHIPGLVD